MKVLFMLSAGIILDKLAMFVWRRWRENLIKAFLGGVTILASGVAIGVFFSLIYGQASPMHRFFAPDNPILCCLIVAIGGSLAPSGSEHCSR